MIKKLIFSFFFLKIFLFLGFLETTLPSYWIYDSKGLFSCCCLVFLQGISKCTYFQIFKWRIFLFYVDMNEESIHRSTDKPCIIKYCIWSNLQRKSNNAKFSKRVTKSNYLTKSLDYTKPLFRPQINTNLEFKSLYIIEP